MPYKNLAFFVSGNGTNLINAHRFFENSNNYKISLVVSNNLNSNAIKWANQKGIETILFSNTSPFINLLIKSKISLIVLAGFLKKIPKELVNVFNNKVINIHPALLPKYGGKGMYGMNVHNAVFKNNETESGITIHYVNENYDEGQIIFQKSCDIKHCQSPEEIAIEVQKLEHKYYPLVIEDLLRNS